VKALAESILTAAAVSAGIAEASVIHAPEKDSITLPMPRLEISFMPEDLKRSFKRILKTASTENPDTHRTIRSRLYSRTLTVRAEVKSEDAAWVETFAAAFIAALPGKTSDDAGNLVTVAVNRAVRGGLEYRLVEVFKKVSNAMYLTFTGMICRDDDIPLIREVSFADVNYKENSNG
jgi:hypothetical protein